MKKCALLVLFACSSLFAYSYSAFAFSSGVKNLLIQPFGYGFTVAGTYYGGGELCLSYGVTDKFDVVVDVNYLYGESVGTWGWWAMPRYDFGDNVIAAVKANHQFVSPQIHFIKEGDRFGIQANALGQFTYDYFGSPAAYAIVSPMVKLGSLIDLFCEVNPAYISFDGDIVGGWLRPEGFGMDVIPGIGLRTNKVLATLAFPFYDITHEVGFSVSAWAIYTVSFKK